MKILKPVERYKCDFCKRVNIQRPAMEKHEAECYRNPNRTCNICDREGLVQRPELGPGLGVIPDAYSVICEACLKARVMGGECYIDREDWNRYVQPVLDENKLEPMSSSHFERDGFPALMDDSDWHLFLQKINVRVRNPVN